MLGAIPGILPCILLDLNLSQLSSSSSFADILLRKENMSFILPTVYPQVKPSQTSDCPSQYHASMTTYSLSQLEPS